jgi:hypothetical protein
MKKLPASKSEAEEITRKATVAKARLLKQEEEREKEEIQDPNYLKLKKIAKASYSDFNMARVYFNKLSDKLKRIATPMYLDIANKRARSILGDMKATLTNKDFNTKTVFKNNKLLLQNLIRELEKMGRLKTLDDIDDMVDINKDYGLFKEKYTIEKGHDIEEEEPEPEQEQDEEPEEPKQKKAKAITLEKKPRGRPRKEKEEKEVKEKKPRGRPRKEKEEVKQPVISKTKKTITLKKKEPEPEPEPEPKPKIPKEIQHIINEPRMESWKERQERVKLYRAKKKAYKLKLNKNKKPQKERTKKTKLDKSIEEVEGYGSRYRR